VSAPQEAAQRQAKKPAALESLHRVRRSARVVVTNRPVLVRVTKLNGAWLIDSFNPV
jgi:hypothetical protein